MAWRSAFAVAVFRIAIAEADPAATDPMLAKSAAVAVPAAGDPTKLGDSRTCKGYEKQWAECKNDAACSVCDPMDCKFTTWQDWYSSGGCIGLDFRRRGILTSNNECGDPCEGPKIESREAPKPECTKTVNDCELGEWSPYSICAGPLDQKHRVRSIKAPPRNGGKPCTDAVLEETLPCKEDNQVNCEFSEWQEWTKCSVTCGGGYHAKLRQVKQHAQHSGQPCVGSLRETEPCGMDSCGSASNCELGEWEPWTVCENGKKQQTRKRKVIAYAQEDGRSCDDVISETRGCPSDETGEEAVCKLSDWSAWTECKQKCKSVRTSRSREVQSAGLVCALQSLYETQPCGDATECDADVVTDDEKDCSFGDWKAWGECSAKCGEGYKQRDREVASHARPDGTPCIGPLREVLPCTSESDGGTCGVQDCKWGDWEEWGGCSCTCGGGTSRRNRVILRSPTNGGELCVPQAKSQIGECNAEPCQKCVDGEWMDWTAWTECSATCGEGYQSRHRDVKKQPNECGQPVTGYEDDYQMCKATEVCIPDQDCQLSEWTPWTGCSNTCFGVMERSRHVTQTQSGLHGKPCDDALKQISPCNPGPNESPPERCSINAPRPCIFAPWDGWGNCSAACDGGQRERTRHILTPGELMGNPCQGAMREAGPCGTEPCSRQAKDCIWKDWEDWGGCSECNGQRYRHRHIKQMPLGDGKLCKPEAAKEVAKCPERNWGCAKLIQCRWTKWSGVGECSTTCGEGSVMKSRQLEMVQYDHHSLPVSQLPTSKSSCAELKKNALDETRMWNDNILNSGGPLDGTIGVKGVCGGRVACGGPNTYQAAKTMCEGAGARLCRQHEYFPGLEAAGQSCNYDGIPIWTQTPCVKPGSSAEAYMTIKLGLNVSDPQMVCVEATDKNIASEGRCCADVVPNAGHDFFFAGYEDMRCGGTQVKYDQCNSKACEAEAVPIDCTFGPWTTWAQPTVSLLCERSRSIVEMGTHGGKSCEGPLVMTKKCVDKAPGPQDCQMSTWDEWSACPDAEDQRFRGRTIIQPAANNGEACKGTLRETAACSGEAPKTEECIFNDWMPWKDCTKTCGGGIKKRERAGDLDDGGFKQRSAAGGEGCEGSMEEIESCNSNDCDSAVLVDNDCLLSEWTVWKTCNKDDKVKTRLRRISQEREGGGSPCVGAMEEIASCPIDIDCGVSPWTGWSTCDKQCGGGQETRHRQITTYPRNKGVACPVDLIETSGCNQQNCGAELDCRVDDWHAWGPCSATCGSGQQSRSRIVTSLAKEGGRGCDFALQELQSCVDVDDCPSTDCAWNDWSQWGDCSCDCDGGQRSRDRSIKTIPLPGGKFCEPFSKEEIEPCATQPCAGSCVDGQWDQWTPWTPCSSTCEGGTSWRNRQVLREADDCGKPAEGPSRETQSCNVVVPCEHDVDCQFGEWVEWGACTKDCSGLKRRTRQIAVAGRGNGTYCNGAIKQTWPCNPAPDEEAPPHCSKGPAVDCKVSEWLEWEACNAACGGGQQKRQRQLLTEPSNGGKGCEDDLGETAGCNTQPCKSSCEEIDCKWGEWGMWSACDKCGGQRKRFRNIIDQPFCGGKACTAQSSEQVSNCTRQCHEPSYCGWTDWQAWSDCSQQCGTGSKWRQRELRLQDATLVARLLEDADEVALEKSFQTLRERSQLADSQRHQELLVAFTCGLLTLSFASFGMRRLGTSRSQGAAVPVEGVLPSQRTFERFERRSYSRVGDEEAQTAAVPTTSRTPLFTREPLDAGIE